MQKKQRFLNWLFIIPCLLLAGGFVWLINRLLYTISSDPGQIAIHPTLSDEHIVFGTVLLVVVILLVALWGWTMHRQVGRKSVELWASEEKNRLLIDSATEGIVILVDGKIEYFNPQVLSILNLKSLPSNPKVNFLDHVHPSDHELILARNQQIMDGSTDRFQIVFRIITSDGQAKWLKSNTVQIDWKGTPALLSFLFDITEEHKLEESIKASEERYRLIFDQSPMGMFYYDTELKITHLNDRFVEIMKSSDDLLQGFDLNSLDNPELIDVLKNVFTHENGQFEGWIKPIRSTSDRELYIKLRTTPLITEKLEYQGGIGLLEDMTGQMVSENKIQNLEEKFSKVVVTSTDAITITRLRDGIFVDVNSGFTEVSGYSREDVIGKSVEDIDLWVNQNDRLQLVNYLDVYGECKNFETLFRRKDGVVHHGMVSASIVEIENNPCMLTITRDIDGMKKMNEVARSVELKYRSIFESVPVSIWQMDLTTVYDKLEALRLEGVEDLSVFMDEHPGFVEETIKMIKVLDVNEVSLKLYKAESKQQLIESLDKILNSESLLSFRQEILAIWKRESQFNGDSVNQTLDGERILINLVMRIPSTREEFKNILVSITDITQRKLTEEALRESEVRYRTIFNSVPVSIKEEDYSQVVTMIEKVRETGITDFEGFLKSHPDWIKQAVKSVKVTEVNQESLRIFKAESKEQLLQPLEQYFTEESYVSFSRQLMALWNHEDLYEQETVNKTVDGEPITVWVSLELPTGKSDYSKVLVTIMDITERKKAEEQIRLQLKYLAALRAVDMAISASLDLPITLRVLLNQIHQQLIADAVAVLILDQHTQTLRYAAGIGFHTNAIESTNLRLGQGFAGQAALERRTILSSDLTAKSSQIKNKELENEEFTHYIGIPLISKGTVKGVLELFNRGPFSQDATWMGLVESMAGQAAIAIENAALMDEVQTVNMNLRSAYDATIEGWAKSIDAGSGDSENHSKQVADLVIELAQTTGYQGEGLLDLRRGALLHDVGKLGIPDKILLKAGPLTEKEWSIMKTHPLISQKLLSSVDFLHPSMDIPLYHHERWDGSGYPNGVAREEIPYAARLFAVVECWVVMRSDRPWRKAWTDENTWDFIERNSGKLFDPQVVEKFRHLLGHGFTVYY